MLDRRGGLAIIIAYASSQARAAGAKLIRLRQRGELWRDDGSSVVEERRGEFG